MPLVIDASVAFKWFVPEVEDDKALALLETETGLFAPDLIFAEVANAMWVRLRKLAEGPAAVAEAQRQLRRILSDVVPAHEFVARASEIAFEINESVYDCIYLAMCEQAGLTLITADKRLLSNVHNTPYQRLARPLE